MLYKKAWPDFNKNRGKMDDIIKKELQQEHIEKIKKIKMKKLHDQIQEKAHYDPTEVNKSIERQTRKLKYVIIQNSKLNN